MKITKSYLKQIIKEELNTLEETAEQDAMNLLIKQYMASHPGVDSKAARNILITKLNLNKASDPSINPDTAANMVSMQNPITQNTKNSLLKDPEIDTDKRNIINKVKTKG